MINKTKVYLNSDDGLFYEVKTENPTDNTVWALFSHALINGYITYAEFKSKAKYVRDDFYDRLWDCWDKIEPSIYPVVASYEQLVNLDDFKVHRVEVDNEFNHKITHNGNKFKN